MGGWLIPIVLGALVAGAVFLAASIFFNKTSSDVRPRIRGRSFAVLAGIVCCIAAIYAVYPYVTLWRISGALQARDGELLASFIDWPTLRENLRSDVKAKLATRSFSADSNQTAFGVIGTAIGLALIDPMINALISPEMLRAWADSHRKTTTLSSPAQSAGRALDSLSTPDNTLMSRVSYAYFTGLTEFRIDISAPDKQSTVTTFLSFSNLSWKVSRLVLPDEDFAKLGSNAASIAPNSNTASIAQAVRQADQVAKNSATTHMNNGISLGTKGDYEAALTEFNTAIELDPANAQSYASRGNLYRVMGKHDRALTDVNEARR